MNLKKLYKVAYIAVGDWCIWVWLPLTDDKKYGYRMGEYARKRIKRIKELQEKTERK